MAWARGIVCYDPSAEKLSNTSTAMTIRKYDRTLRRYGCREIIKGRSMWENACTWHVALFFGARLVNYFHIFVHPIDWVGGIMFSSCPSVCVSGILRSVRGAQPSRTHGQLCDKPLKICDFRLPSRLQGIWYDTRCYFNMRSDWCQSVARKLKMWKTEN